MQLNQLLLANVHASALTHAETLRAGQEHAFKLPRHWHEQARSPKCSERSHGYD